MRLGAEEVILPREDDTNWLSSAKWSALKNIYDHSNAYTCALTISKKRIRFEESGEGYMEEFRDRKGRNIVIKNTVSMITATQRDKHYNEFGTF